jgi:hypothetical protein
MTVASAPRRILDSIVYWVRLALLTVYGPATLDDEHDPILALKREHQRQHASDARALTRC